ncbi:MAG: glucuronate isomerase [Planctomycetota bacterium]
MAFIHDDFLLSTATSRRLYHDFAASQPIYDYHGHLPPQDLASDRRFADLAEAWLEGDHYKWRAMRAAGVDERFCTGDAEPWEKFLAFARVVPQTLRNPLYHWCHLELKRYFDIDTTLNADTARDVWDEANRQLADMPVSVILRRFGVKLIGTTDAPEDGLEHHAQLAASDTLGGTAVYPAFRPDRTHQLGDPETWNGVIDAVGRAAGVSIDRLDDLFDALAKRHRFFHDHGARLSDHGLTHLPDVEPSQAAAEAVFDRARAGGPVDAAGQDVFTASMMNFFGRLDHAAGWTHQLHLGALRNNNAWALERLGPDTGFDSIGDERQAPGLRRHLGTLAGQEALPKTILYNLNPDNNELFATMAGNFQSAPTPGRVQFGSGWWFLDQKDGMTKQLNALSNCGLLAHFVGMTTDSRSFLSFPRHEYFRRVLCDLLGREKEAGELPDDLALVGGLVKDLCFDNARRYFGMALCDRD